MAWMKVDDRLHSHRKTRAVTRSHDTKARDIAPLGLWVAAGSWASQNGTEGWVPADELDRWDDEWKSLASRLVEAGYWWAEERNGESGYGFHDWHDYNLPIDAASNSGRYGNHVRWHVKEGKIDPECEHCPQEPHTDDDPPESPPDIAPRSGPDIAPRIAKSIGGDRSTRTQPEPSPARTQPEPDATSKRGTQLPKNWKPTPEHLERAMKSGVVLGREVDKFKAHAEENARVAKNWNAAFTRWLINAEEYAQRDRPADRPPRPHASQLELPPDGLSPDEYADWEREQRRKRGV